MKAIKVILGIISFLVLIFFLTGLIVKETNYSAQISINKPIGEVFKSFNQPGNVQKWIPEIKSIDTLNLNPGFTGSEFRMVVNNQGQEITMTEKVLAYVANEKVTLFFDAENMLKTDDYIFSEKNGITTVTLNSSCESDSYIMACLYPYFEGVFQSQDQTYLNSFKAYLEKK
ncbi:SRPBCC family protein [Polaribacter aquimarinus]|uniref:1,4-dihydroxy-2-naphthoate prenyltransferase n=1 Tax=Polaribacter aquimarinus TaxID=2100726 RepID=A0A2U2JAB9_9FLAO|nr:1,4-dihydroxy-2-naphthoate prenyltransferase [Polaribacter aquimarinus]PWG05272.1 1,4-dihydroxy-2-naphthoate prenyltransferase [Polaribacter aquimarinus]